MESSVRIFDLFSKMIRELPARAILKALAQLCKTLEDDLNKRRSAITIDAFSILYFGQFVRLAQLGKAMCVVESFPPEHIEFYRETITRLVQSEQLPASAVAEFDKAFAVGL
jgi:hypothetical protein